MSADPARRRRRPTSTSEFGVGRREAHDASDFYARFTPPELSADEIVARQPVADEIHRLDARRMTELVKPNSVALVVTSPPYFAGKAYETDLQAEGIPASYLEYLQLLHEVFAACVEVLEPGGRIAVNVANLGRKPYRSLAADVIGILQDHLGLLLRGEIIWRKGQANSGSCTWGSFRSAANPVLRDQTERVIVASKGRFDRALSKAVRRERGLPHHDTIAKDDFMEWTNDVWELLPERATRVGHPAPFPVELPRRFIELYTYRGDVVLDPFMGVGSTAVAAVRAGRRYLGFETDPDYIAIAGDRIAAARAAGIDAAEGPGGTDNTDNTDNTRDEDAEPDGDPGASAKELARRALLEAGFTEIADKGRAAGIELSFRAHDQHGNRWLFDVAGAATPVGKPGLQRSEVLWRALGRAAAIAGADRVDAPVVVLTTALPDQGTPGGRALAAVRGHQLFDAIDVTSAAGRDRLRGYAQDGPGDGPRGELW